MDLGIFSSTFGIIFLAELGDKTQLTAMALAARYPWKKVFPGLAVAFVLLNLGAVLVGKLLFTLLPLFWIKLVSAGLFFFFGIATLLANHNGADGPEKDQNGSFAQGPFITSFLLIFLAELGDKTQIVTASLAAQHNAPTGVFLGSTLALWSVSLAGMFLGLQLTRFVPLSSIRKVAGSLFLAFGIAILYQTIIGSERWLN